MVHFLTLPVEVRIMIYKYCLVVGKVFPYTFREMYNYHYHNYTLKHTKRFRSGYELPAVHILTVCKTVHQEAETMLYQDNTLVLPTGDLTARFFKTCLNTEARRASVKSIEVTLESADMIEKDKEICLKNALPLYRHDMLNPTRRGMRDFYNDLHEYQLEDLVLEIWPRKLKPVLDFLLLDKLVVDLGKSRCPGGCCKIDDHDTRKAFSSGFAMGVPRVVKLRDADNAEYYKAYITRKTAKRQSMLGGAHYEE